MGAGKGRSKRVSTNPNVITMTSLDDFKNKKLSDIANSFNLPSDIFDSYDEKEKKININYDIFSTLLTQT